MISIRGNVATMATNATRTFRKRRSRSASHRVPERRSVGATRGLLDVMGAALRLSERVRGPARYGNVAGTLIQQLAGIVSCLLEAEMRGTNSREPDCGRPSVGGVKIDLPLPV